MPGAPAEGWLLLLVGRPGSGKTELSRRLADRLVESGRCSDVRRVDDCGRLWDVFRREEAAGDWRRCRRSPGGGYEVTDPTLWDDVLRDAAAEADGLLAPGRAVILEFARRRYLPVLAGLPRRLFRNATLAYVDSPFETCWRRNLARSSQGAGDAHLVSREEMEATYREDDRDELLRAAPCPTVRVDNSSDDLSALGREVERLCEAMPR
jgi:hypothetical protein